MKKQEYIYIFVCFWSQIYAVNDGVCETGKGVKREAKEQLKDIKEQTSICHKIHPPVHCFADYYLNRTPS